MMIHGTSTMTASSCLRRDSVTQFYCVLFVCDLIPELLGMTKITWTCGWLFFLPQGHAAPALYSMWVEAGFLKENELLSLCHVDSTLEGHQTTVSLYLYCPIPCESSDEAQIVYQQFMIPLHHVGCVVHISEAALCGFSNWLFGAGSWCGLWNGLHWEIL